MTRMTRRQWIDRSVAAIRDENRRRYAVMQARSKRLFMAPVPLTGVGPAPLSLAEMVELVIEIGEGKVR